VDDTRAPRTRSGSPFEVRLKIALESMAICSAELQRLRHSRKCMAFTGVVVEKFDSPLADS
jgi:hypothetical protein